MLLNIIGFVGFRRCSDIKIGEDQIGARKLSEQDPGGVLYHWLIGFSPYTIVRQLLMYVRDERFSR